MAERKEVKVLVDSLTSEGKSIKANSVEKLLEEDYEKLTGLGNVRDYDEELDGEVEEADESVLEGMIETLEDEKKVLEEKVTELENNSNGGQDSQDKITALEGEKTALEEKLDALSAQLEEAINLPKGQKPAGYEKA